MTDKEEVYQYLYDLRFNAIKLRNKEERRKQKNWKVLGDVEDDIEALDHVITLVLKSNDR